MTTMTPFTVDECNDIATNVDVEYTLESIKISSETDDVFTVVLERATKHLNTITDERERLLTAFTLGRTFGSLFSTDDFSLFVYMRYIDDDDRKKNTGDDDQIRDIFDILQ